MQEPPLSTKSGELLFVREMFERIAPRYDFLNRLLSLRQDIVWRRALIGALNLADQARVLDAACGTGDVALALAQQGAEKIQVIGADFACSMLLRAGQKVRATGRRQSVWLAAADVLQLPFPTATFDAVTMAFGIRNIQDKHRVLKCFFEQLKPGGRLAILELGTPSAGPLRRAYLFYFNRFLPLIGRFFSRHHFAYTYLPDSVANFPPAPQFAALMRAAGFVDVRYRLLSFGIAALFVGDKPDQER
jgi:demethylmenaquinone methyltransferase / 2-methoxy-6-polyprenyl-1,4-benzoquinol methylase